MFKQLVARQFSLFCAAIALSSSFACRKETGTTAAVGVGSGEPLSAKRGLLIASGLGAIDGLAHTNSIEALQCNYRRGFRWFEVNLTLTEDGELLALRRGDERLAGLQERATGLSVADVEGKRYASRFPIVRLSNVVEEADRLGDVVLVLGTGGWSQKLAASVSKTLGSEPKHPTRIVLQAYGEKDFDVVAPVSRALGASLILNLSQADIGDEQVVEMVKQRPFLAVAANTGRFTPWLAERLHASQVPLLVQAVNDHRDIVDFARAGADGFYTDRYIPYESIAQDPTRAMGCGEAKPSPIQLRQWQQRDLGRASDYRLSPCAKRAPDGIELGECDDRAALRSTPLAVPASQTLHVELDVEAQNRPVNLWLELAQKQKPTVVRPREVVTLKAKERRSLRYDVELPLGSLGVEARVGLGSSKDSLTLHHLALFHGEKIPDSAAPSSSSTPDAGE